MRGHLDQLDPIETLLAEGDEAERAGVFRPTRIDAAELTRRPGGGSVPFFVSWRRFGVPLAACFVLAAGVWTFLFNNELSSIHARRMASDNVSVGVSPEGFLRCLDGPAAGAGGDCASYDHDADGDVDLLDYSAFQSSYTLADAR